MYQRVFSKILQLAAFSDGLFVLSFQRIGEPQQSAGDVETRVHFERLLELRDRFIVATGNHVDLGHVRVDDEREGVQLLGAFERSDSFVEPPDAGEELAIPLVSCRVIWIQLNRPLELLLGLRPVPVEIHRVEPERGMRFRQGFINLERLLEGGPAPGQHLFLPIHVIAHKKEAGVR